METLKRRCKQAIKLFEDGKKQIQNQTSFSYKNLTKLTLIFSHMLQELQAVFPNGIYAGETYTLTQKDADDFWKSSFPDK